MTELDAEKELEYRTRTGVPIQLVDLRIVDEQMHDVPRDGKASGEVVVRAPWLTQGYLNNPANSEHLWRGGSLHTDATGPTDPQRSLLNPDLLKHLSKTTP